MTVREEAIQWLTETANNIRKYVTNAASPEKYEWVANLLQCQNLTGRDLYNQWWEIYGSMVNPPIDHPYYKFEELPAKQQDAYNELANRLNN